jgi:hypothetical protein
MPYIAKNLKFEHKSYGTGQCVALVQAVTGAPNHTLWRAGPPVRGNTAIKPGTAIATFVDGVYPSHATGNHAAIYVSQDAKAIYVYDQWKNSRVTQPAHLRPIWFDGSHKSISDDGNAFSVIVSPAEQAQYAPAPTK